MYKRYSLQLNVLTVIKQELRHMFSLTTAQHITVHILYKLYNLQLNCTYSNYTEAAATCLAAHQHRNCPADVF